jgi:signal transduction histidine kinase
MSSRRRLRDIVSRRAMPREKVAAALRGLILLTVLLMARTQAGPRSPGLDLVVSIGAAYVLVSIFLPWARFDTRSAALVMLVADVALITALLHTQGGLKSDYYILYYLPVLHASVRLNFRDAVGTSLLAAASYLFVGILDSPAARLDAIAIVRMSTFVVSAVALAGFFLALGREQKTLARLADSYSQAVYANTEFLSHVSHEFRTPLTAIVGFSQLLFEHSQTLDPARQREYLVIIREQAQHLARMIEDIFDLSRIEADRLTLKIQPVSLGEAMQAALMLVDEGAVRERVRSTVEPRTPAASADRNELEQVLSRLLLLGLSLAKDGAPVSVLVGPAPVGAEGGAQGKAAAPTSVQVSVQIPGIEGTEEELKPLVGSLESSLALAHENAKHLAMAVTRALVELHGGKIGVADMADGGAAVSFTLPAYRPGKLGPAVIVGEPPSEGQPVTATPAGGSGVIVVMGSGSNGAEGKRHGKDNDRRRRPVRTTADEGQS